MSGLKFYPWSIPFCIFIDVDIVEEDIILHDVVLYQLFITERNLWKISVCASLGKKDSPRNVIKRLF